MITPSDVVWELPEPLSTHDVAMHDGAVVTLRRHGNPAGPRLVLSHGNGLAIDLYYPFWSLLADRFDLVVYDLRKHGWNTSGDLSEHTVPTLVEDFNRTMEAIEHRYGKKLQVGIFHSISGLVALLSARNGRGFEALVLFDPPLCRPGSTYEIAEAAAARNAARTRRRSNSFRSPRELAEVLPYLPSFQRVVPGLFDLMARTTLHEHDGESGYQLRCPPEYEAQIIEYASAFAVAVDLEAIRCPVKAICADPTLPYSFWPSFNLAELMKVEYDFIPDTTHFLQLEKPEECVDRVLEFIDPIIAKRGE